jgi:hypothetical protein
MVRKEGRKEKKSECLVTKARQRRIDRSENK